MFLEKPSLLSFFQFSQKSEPENSRKLLQIGRKIFCSALCLEAKAMRNCSVSNEAPDIN